MKGWDFFNSSKQKINEYQGETILHVLTDLLHNMADLLSVQENHKSNDENNYKWQWQLQLTAKGVRGLKSPQRAINNPNSQVVFG